MFIISCKLVFSLNSTCPLPKTCTYKQFDVINALWNEEFISQYWWIGISCQINDFFSQFNTSSWTRNNCKFPSMLRCYLNLFSPPYKRYILDKSFGFENFFLGFALKTGCEFGVRVSNTRGLGVNFFKKEIIQYNRNKSSNQFFINSRFRKDLATKIEFVKTRMDFYIEEKHLKTCQDFSDSNISHPMTIFNIAPMNGFNNAVFIRCEFKNPICPLVFKNVSIEKIFFYGMINSFYKTSYIRFTNDTNRISDLDSYVRKIYLFSCENLHLDIDFLNPLVFEKLRYINIYNSVRKINPLIFEKLKKIQTLKLLANNYREIIHSSGKKIFHSINSHVNVDYNDPKSIENNLESLFWIILTFFDYNRVSLIFPDKDFCIYHDFPFKQFLIITFIFGDMKIPKQFKMDFTCTYLWLIQYYSKFVDFIKYDEVTHFYITYNLNTNVSKPVCDFTKMIFSCNKTNFKINKILTISNFKDFNNGLKFFLISFHYILSVFGIYTNWKVIFVIRNKKNKEIFKEFKQYTYLCINSFLNLVILIIQILSWFVECSDLTFIFCPVTHFFIAFQFIKIIFKECLITALRFMCNFTYVAFSLNRISLIGKDHGKIVQFMSKCSIKYYTGFTGFLSIGFSIVKGFKYKVNYSHELFSYPIKTELDGWENHGWQKEAYLITNMIIDFLNYFVFVFLNLAIDIYMVVKLKKTIQERESKFENVKKSIKNVSDDKGNKKNKTNETNQDVINQVIKLVVINNGISILFKLPFILMPIFNSVAFFYYQSFSLENNPRFRIIFEFFLYSGFSDQIFMLSDVFYSLSISIQFFIYKRFDKKFKQGYEQLP